MATAGTLVVSLGHGTANPFSIPILINFTEFEIGAALVTINETK